MRLLKRVFWITILALAVVFAATNMQIVTVEFDPIGLGYEALRGVQMPLAAVIFVTLAIGLLVGVLLENDRGRPARRELGSYRAELARLEREADRMRATMKAADHPDSAGLPVRRT